MKHSAVPILWLSSVLLVLGIGCEDRTPELQAPNTPQVTPKDEPAKPADSALTLPKQFTDRLRYPAFAESEDPGLRRKAEPAFEMVLIPGDPERGIKPFYLSKNEVRGAMFWPMVTGLGMGWGDHEIRDRFGFWPSEVTMWLWEGQRIVDDFENLPAIAMSRTVAEQYCVELSAMTGRRYRLPTEAEWAHAQRLAGGIPNDPERLLAVAVLKGNADYGEFGIELKPARVGSLPADSLGLHDLLGNAAEWVTDTGNDRVVRGGHFDLPADQLVTDWRAVEDIEVWNASYPLRPVSRAFYRDFYFTGIRLCCDADQAPADAQEP